MNFMAVSPDGGSSTCFNLYARWRHTDAIGRVPLHSAATINDINTSFSRLFVAIFTMHPLPARTIAADR
ncbi:hypothetical protein, partial [Paraburkholderia piptadeniae]|uniref:hypothetical protein n=1 Tax=Paraburkholderia piptadeniae TaxID=1701573 RepID=UPI001C45C3FC